jgi:UDP-N-acetylmuramate dehydrogenase
VILTARLQLVQRRRDEIVKMIQENLSIKKTNQPLSEKSAGSFFKNPGQGKEMSAGYLLEKAGAKKIKIAGASFSKKHANFLINSRNATASDIRDAANQAKEKVREKFNLALEEEVEYIGRWKDV